MFINGMTITYSLCIDNTNSDAGDEVLDGEADAGVN